MKPCYLWIIVAVLNASLSAHAADMPPGKPASARWQIHPVVYGQTTDDKVVSRSEHTILFDTQTGKSWLLWPTKDTPAGWSWIELIQRKDAPPKTPKAE